MSRPRGRLAAALGLAALLAGAVGDEAPPKGTLPELAGGGETVLMRLKPEAKLEHREKEGCWIGTGGIVMRRGNATLTASQIVYWDQEGAAYAEGFLVFEDPDRRVFAARGYYNWNTRQGRLEKGRVIRHDPDRGIHYYLRGESIDLDGPRTTFHGVSVTTCSFADPHYAWRADQMTLTEGGHGLGQLVSTGNVLKLGGTSVLTIPQWTRDLQKTSFPLKESKAARERDLGDYLRTTWGLPWGDFWGDGGLYAHVDYFTRHGWGGGPEARWSRHDDKTDYEGKILAYGIKDRGKDPGDAPLQTEDRGWLYAVDHRFYPKGWSSIVEYSKLSDPTFLPLYFEKEARTGKEQESRVYVQRVEGDYAGSFLVRPRLNDFQDQVKYLPKADFRVLNKSFLDGKVLWNSTTEVAQLKHTVGDNITILKEDQTEARLDTKHEAIMPFSMGPVHVQAFADERATWFSQTQESNIDQMRVISGGGLRLGTQFLKPLDTTSEYWNIRALRHIIVPQVEYRTDYDATIRNDRLQQFDSVDAADRFEKVTFSLDNIWQAKRRPARRQETDQPEAEPPPLVTGDFATLSLQQTYFPMPHRDDNDHPWSPVEGEFRIFPRDYLAAYTDWTYNPEVSDGIETWNVGMTINPDYAEAFGSDRFGRSRFSAKALETDSSGSPNLGTFSDRWSLNMENRYVKRDSSTMNVGVTYVFSERWSMGINQEYQWIPGHRGDQKILLKRDLHEWTAEFSVGSDATHGANVLFLVYPKGLF